MNSIQALFLLGIVGKSIRNIKTKSAILVSRIMDFFNTIVSGLTTVVTAIGSGIGVWGVINLLESYGSENAANKSQGIKQLMAGGGIVIIAQTVIPQLTTLFG